MKVKKIFLRFLLVLFTFLLITFGGLYYTLYCICKGPSKAASELFVTTILETGMLQFLASWYYTDEEIMEITNRNAMEQTVEEVDKELIVIGGESGDDSMKTALH